MKAPRCPACPGFGRLLGSLGRLNWFHCRDCGIVFHHMRRPNVQRTPSFLTIRRSLGDQRLQ